MNRVARVPAEPPNVAPEPRSTEARPVRDVAAALYGVILATALTAAYSEYSATDAGQIALAVLVTAIVFWLAHAYATVLAHGLVHHGRFSHEAAASALLQESPLLLGALPAIAALLLAPLGLLSDYHAENAAIGAGVVTLGLGGLVAGIRQQAVFGRTLAMTVASTALGLAMVALKAIVH
jgi:hypothetical protein